MKQYTVSSLIAQSLTIAALVWGQPACGQPHVAWVSPVGDLPSMAWGAAIVRTPYTPLAGWPGGQPLCTISLNRLALTVRGRGATARELQREMICHTVVHEWGHLTGHGHSKNPANVMWGDEGGEAAAQPYWRCLPPWRARFGKPVRSS